MLKNYFFDMAQDERRDELMRWRSRGSNYNFVQASTFEINFLFIP